MKIVISETVVGPVDNDRVRIGPGLPPVGRKAVVNKAPFEIQWIAFGIERRDLVFLNIYFDRVGFASDIPDSRRLVVRAFRLHVNPGNLNCGQWTGGCRYAKSLIVTRRIGT